MSQGGEDNYENLIALCPNCHRLVHIGKIDRKSLRAYKADLRYVFDKYFPWEMDILFDLYKAGKHEGVLWLSFMNLLIRRIIDSGFVEMIEKKTGVFVGGIKSSPDYLIITDKGRQFVDDLKQSNLFQG